MPVLILQLLNPAIILIDNSLLLVVDVALQIRYPKLELLDQVLLILLIGLRNERQRIEAIQIRQRKISPLDILRDQFSRLNK